MRIRLIGLLLILLLPNPSWSLSSDKLQTAYLSADSALLNHKIGIDTYQGHVVLTQGTTIVHADTLIVYFNQKHLFEKAVALGNQASYKTLPDNSRLEFISTANRIEYQPLAHHVILIGNAQANQGRDFFKGPRIEYDIASEIVTAPQSQAGRSLIIIQPDQKE